MKKIISSILVVLMLPIASLADCDFKDLIHNADGTVTYSKADHICVGQLVQDNATKTQQIKDYTQALTLKDLALTKADQRTQLWLDTSLKLEDNIQKVDSLQKTSFWVSFGLGALTVIGTGIMASQMVRH
jgi:hypothetical protein